MPINFKSAAKHDVNLLLDLMQKLYAVDGSVTFNATFARKALMQLFSDESMGRVWLIQDENQTVGYVVLTLSYSLEYGGRDAFIDEFYIESDYQNQGIGKQTIEFLEEVCISLDVQAIHLEVEKENTSAQGFYRRVGFEDHNRYLMTKHLYQIK